jgi:hypothetical protein
MRAIGPDDLTVRRAGAASSRCAQRPRALATDPRQTFEQHLVRDWRYGAETAAARAQQVPITTLEGSIDETPITLELVTPICD